MAMPANPRQGLIAGAAGIPRNMPQPVVQQQMAGAAAQQQPNVGIAAQQPTLQSMLQSMDQRNRAAYEAGAAQGMNGGLRGYDQAQQAMVQQATAQKLQELQAVQAARSAAAAGGIQPYNTATPQVQKPATAPIFSPRPAPAIQQPQIGASPVKAVNTMGKPDAFRPAVAQPPRSAGIGMQPAVTQRAPQNMQPSSLGFGSPQGGQSSNTMGAQTPKQSNPFKI